MTELILNALWILGFSKLFEAGMIFEEIDVWIMTKLNVNHHWLLKPVYACPPCMSSIHGLIGAVFFGIPFILIPVYIVMLAGLLSFAQKLMYR